MADLPVYAFEKVGFEVRAAGQLAVEAVLAAARKLSAWGGVFGGIALVTAPWAVSSPLAHATTSNQFSFTVPVTTCITVDPGSWCSNSGGPNIVLDTSANVGGTYGMLTFENNLKGTHELSVVVLEQGLELGRGGRHQREPGQR